jgi:hypothetical protein
MATNQFITFWQFIQGQKIEIPIIQRDYAQGRNGKEKLREKFLKDLKHALDNNDSNSKLKLDFVYGTLESEKLQPLDGQQRLTTLWLLHWYIAFKAGKLADNKEVFKRFTYETRTSSREFCHKLSEFSDSTSNKIVSHIQNQTWFYSIWKQDPTIQAMLNMLGGTDICEKNIDIVDGIEELFTDNFEYYWNILTSENCPIIFYYMPLNELKLSDDLYIKMNARGKPLTSFENFKADLVGFMKSKNEDNNTNIDKSSISDIRSFEHKLDTDWTDIFWKNKSENFKIDEIYFAFFNRYFLNKLITAKKTNGKDLLTQKEIESNKLFRYLYGESGNDTKVKYNSFDVYESENLLNKELFEGLNQTLDNFYSAFKNISKNEINMKFYPSWDDNSNFRFIPEYVENATNNNNEPKYIPSLITQPQRVIFHAICCYFENNQYDEISFKQWMRVVWNIVENANIANEESMFGAIRLINDLVKYADNIYNHLKDRDVSNDFAKDQMEEEKEKAKKIIEDSTWEENIIEAENWSFFKGAIRFLFRIDNNTYDWGKFSTRFAKCKIYFDKDGVASDHKEKSILLRFFISKFNKFDHFKMYYDNSNSSWKLNLLRYRSVINAFLDSENIKYFDFSSFKSVIQDTKLQFFQNDLVKTEILNHICPACTFHWWNYGGYYSLYPYNTKTQSKIFVLADKRNDILRSLEIEDLIKVDDWQKIVDSPFYKGWEIFFTSKLNSKKYQWWGNLKAQSESGEWVDVEGVDLNNLREHLQKQS